MASGYYDRSSTRDDLRAALEAISHFEEINAEAARVLAEQTSRDGENAAKRDDSTSDPPVITNGTAEDSVVTNGTAMGSVEPDKNIVSRAATSGIGNGVGFRQDAGMVGETVYNYDDWNRATGSESQASDMVNSILANASKAVLEHVNKNGELGGDSKPDIHQTSPPPDPVKSSSPDLQEDKRAEAGSDWLGSESDEYYASDDDSFTLTESDDAEADLPSVAEYSHIEKEAVNANMATMMDKMNARVDEPKDPEVGGDAKTATPPNVAKSPSPMDEESKEAEAESDAPESVVTRSSISEECVTDDTSSCYSDPNVEANIDENAYSSRIDQGDVVENQELSADLKAFRDQFNDPHFNKPDEPKVAPSHDSGRGSIAVPQDRETEPSEITDSPREAVWKAPVPLIRSNTFTKEFESIPEPSVEPEDQDANQEPTVWKAPQPLIMSPKDKTFPELETDSPRDGTLTENDRVPSTDELMQRFQHLKDDDDVTPPGGAGEEHETRDRVEGTDGATETMGHSLYEGYIDVAGSDQEGSLASSIHTTESVREEPRDTSDATQPDEAVENAKPVTDAEDEADDRILTPDEPVPVLSVKAEETKASLSSEFKSSVDTSVWSASDEEVKDQQDDQIEVGDELIEQHIVPEDPEPPAPGTSAGFATLQSMFHVPPPREPEDGYLDELYHRDAGAAAEDTSATNVAVGESAVDVPDPSTLEDDKNGEVKNETVEEDKSDDVKAGPVKLGRRRSKTGKLKKRGSVGKDIQVEKHHEVKADGDVRPEEQDVAEAEGKVVPESSEPQGDEPAGIVELRLHRRHRKKRRDSKSKESKKETEAPPQETQDDGGVPSLKAEETSVEQELSKPLPEKPRRRSSRRTQSEETKVSFVEKDDGVESVTDASSDRQSRSRQHRSKKSRVSGTLYRPQPFTNEDMLEEKYVELFDIMKSDGVKTGELVKEVGVALARAGLSPRSPHPSPRPVPHAETSVTNAPRAEDKFVPVPGVHVIPTESSPAPVTRPVPAERKSLKRQSDAPQHRGGHSLERTQQRLYRKYNEVTALLSQELHGEADELVQEQLSKTLHLLQKSHKSGHPRPEDSGAAQTSSQGLRPRSTKTVNFSEPRPGSSRLSRSRRRREDSSHVTSDSDGESRSRSRSFSPTDCNLASTKHPDIKLWLHAKNRQLRKQKREERLKELKEKQLEEEKKKEREEKAKESSVQVQKWIKDKRRSALLQRRQEAEAHVRIGNVSAADVSAEEYRTLTPGISGIVPQPPGQKLPSDKAVHDSRPKRPYSAPGISNSKTQPVVSKRKPLSATADNIVQSNKGGAAVKPDIRDESGDGNAEKKPRRPRRRRKKENKSADDEANAEKEKLLKNRLSYDQWLKDKHKCDKVDKIKKKEKHEQMLRESDPMLNSIVPDLARRRIRLIESNKKRVDSGVEKIDASANSYPKVGSGATRKVEQVDFALNGDADKPTEQEEKYQWRLEGEVSRPRSSKPRAPKSSARPSSSPVSKTRARARLTMPKSTSSPRSRADNISEQGPNPFKSPIESVNASLKRSGDARNRYAKKLWTGFSGDVWEQVNEAEGVAQGAGEAGSAEQGQGGEGASGTVLTNAPSPTQEENITSGGPDAESASVEQNEQSVPETENVDNEDSVGPDSASGNVADTTSPRVNFSGIFYTVDTDGIQHDIHEAPDHEETETSSPVPENETIVEPEPDHDKPSNPNKKTVNFGGIVYEIDKQEVPPSSGSGSEIGEELDAVDGMDDEGDAEGFFITSVDDEQ